MRYVKLFVCVLMLLAITVNVANVYGADFLSDIIGEGHGFFTPGSGTDQGGLGAAIETALKTKIVPMIETVGNLIFYVVAAFLGLKYIWSSVEGKSQVKETLPTFVAATCIFYLAQTVYDVATGVMTDITAGSDFSAMSSDIWANVSLVVNIFAFAGILALGLKYMFSSADTRADIKKDMVPLAIGIVLIYSLTNVLNFIVGAGGDILP